MRSTRKTKTSVDVNSFSSLESLTTAIEEKHKIQRRLLNLLIEDILLNGLSDHSPLIGLLDTKTAWARPKVVEKLHRRSSLMKELQKLGGHSVISNFGELELELEKFASKELG